MDCGYNNKNQIDICENAMTKRVNAMLIRSERRKVGAPYEACIEEHFRAPVRNLYESRRGRLSPDKGNRYRQGLYRLRWGNREAVLK